MEKRKLGSQGLEVSALGLGCNEALPLGAVHGTRYAAPHMAGLNL